MDEAEPVRGVQRTAHLGRQARDLDRLQPPAHGQRPGEVDALDEAHREIEPAVRVAGVIDRDHMRVVDRRSRLALALEALAELGIGRDLGADHLERDLAPEGEVHGAVHESHAATSQDGTDDVTGERGAWLQLSHAGWSYQRVPRRATWTVCERMPPCAPAHCRRWPSGSTASWAGTGCRSTPAWPR